jgi:hypothetical protein
MKIREYDENQELMKNYGVPEETVIDLVGNGEWRKILKETLDDENGNPDRIVHVDLRRTPFDDTKLNNEFKMKYAEELPGKKCPLVMFFPNTNAEKDKVLYTDDYKRMYALDHAIKHALDETKVETKFLNTRKFGGLKLAIACGPSYIYCIWGVLGEHNYYVYWLETLHLYNNEGFRAKKDYVKNVPILVEMDGHGRYVSIVVLDYDDVPEIHFCDQEKDTLDPMNMESLNLKSHKESIYPVNEPMFNCEKFDRLLPKTVINTTSDKLAQHSVCSFVVKQTPLVIPYEKDESDSNSKVYISDGVSLDMEKFN